MSNSIDPSLYLANRKVQVKQTGQQTLGKDDFLKILMVQLQNQDPANPMEDKEFISQMATFSSLEQMTNLNSSMKKFMEVQKKSSMANFSQYLGKEVSWEREVKDDNGNVTEIKTGSGVVNSIETKGDNILFVLEDGSKITSEQITKMNPYNISNDQVQGGFNQYAVASTLIGKKASYLNEKSDELVELLVTSAHFKDGKTFYELDDGSRIEPNQIVKISS